MTVTALGQLLGSVISSYMAVDPSRVVLKDEAYDAPKDQGIYILIEHEDTDVIAITDNVDPASGIETMGQSTYEHFAIEIISRSRDAQDRKQEPMLALKSVAGTQAAESNQVSFFRSSAPIDLSEVAGAEPLRRYRIAVIVSNVQTKTGSEPVPQIGLFPSNSVSVEAQ